MNANLSEPLWDKSISLWLIPEEPERSALKAIIAKASEQEASAPAFTPHITLYSPFPSDQTLIDQTQIVHNHLADINKRFQIPTEGLEMEVLPAQKGGTFFQSVLAPIKMTKALDHLGGGFEDILGDPGKQYFPHISLMYGDYTPERRDEVAEMINDGKFGDVPSTVRVKEVAFVDCTGDPKGWRVLATMDGKAPNLHVSSNVDVLPSFIKK